MTLPFSALPAEPASFDTNPPAPYLGEPDAQSVDYLAGIIREVDGNHTLGAAALAEAILLKMPGLVAHRPINPDDVSTTRNRTVSPDRLYPKTDVYTFGEFAGAVIELGGYGDVSWVDPYTGDRVNLFRAFPDGEPSNLTGAVRRLCDAVDLAIERDEFGKPVVPEPA